MVFPIFVGIENEYGFFLAEDYQHARWFREYRERGVGLTPADVAALKIIDATTLPSFKAEEPHVFFIGDFAGVEVVDVLKGLSPEERDAYREVLRMIGASGRMLSNGARFYVDFGHPEFSTAGSTSIMKVIAADKAGERIVESARKRIEEELEIDIRIHKDNSDRFGHSFATHENYLLEPGTFEEVITPGNDKGIQLINLSVARPILCGAGKVGSEREGLEADYQISQRADFIVAEWDEDTRTTRAIINTRDRPYADPKRFRRFHNIMGDANLCEYAGFLKLGVTAIFLKMLRDDFIRKSGSFLRYPLENPVLALGVVSRDLSMKEALALGNGKTVTGLNILEETLRLENLYFEKEALPSEEEKEVLKIFEFFMTALKEDWTRLYGYSDWVTKYLVISRAQQKTGLKWDSLPLKRMDWRYHDLDPERSHYCQLDKKGEISHLLSEADIAQAVKEPPPGRAYLRGKCIERFGEKINIMSWDFIHFKTKQVDFRIDLPNPSIEQEAAEEVLSQLASLFSGRLRSLDQTEDVSFKWYPG